MDANHKPKAILRRWRIVAIVVAVAASLPLVGPATPASANHKPCNIHAQSENPDASAANGAYVQVAAYPAFNGICSALSVNTYNIAIIPGSAPYKPNEVHYNYDNPSFEYPPGSGQTVRLRETFTCKYLIYNIKLLRVDADGRVVRFACPAKHVRYYGDPKDNRVSDMVAVTFEVKESAPMDGSAIGRGSKAKPAYRLGNGYVKIAIPESYANRRLTEDSLYAEWAAYVALARHFPM